MPYSEIVPVQVALSVDGAPLAARVAAALADLRVADSVGVPSYARLVFLAETTGTGLDADSITMAMGQRLEVQVDNGSASWTIFDGLVVSLGMELDTGTSQHVIVEAYDHLYKLGRASVATTYNNQSAAAIIRQLASQAGLRVGSIDQALNGVVPKSTYQYATAYAYIDRLVRDAGCEWRMQDGALTVKPRTAGSASLSLSVGENLISFQSRFSASEHVDEVKVTGWDLKNKSAIVGTASSTGTGMASTIGMPFNTVKTSGVGGTVALSIPRPVVDQTDAENLAKGIVRRREGGMLRARGEAFPAPALAPGSTLDISGLGSKWSGTYYCTGVEHTIGTGSFRSFFDIGPTEPDSLVDIFADSPASTLDKMLGSFTVGIVTNNKDEEGYNRVKVKLPYLSEQGETSWARVLQPGSGNARGWNVLPEINDEVLVGFEHGDLDRPLVLGGLSNGKDKPKYGHADVVKNGKVQARMFNSRLGHEIRLSDGDGPADQFLKLHTAGGEAGLTLGVEGITLEAKDIPVTVKNSKGSIEIDKNGNITMKGQKVTIEAQQDVTINGMNVNIKSKAAAKLEAGATLDLKATAPATLQSSAITAVKGSMVQIN